MVERQLIFWCVSFRLNWVMCSPGLGCGTTEPWQMVICGGQLLCHYDDHIPNMFNLEILHIYS